MSRLPSRIIAAGAFALAAAAHAAPTVTQTAPRFGFSFSEYVGDAMLGSGGLGQQNVAYWVHEGTGEYNGQQVDSWFVFVSPTYDRLKGWLRFDGRIEAVFDSRIELLGSASFESDAHAYSYGRWVGLEGLDSFAVRGRAMQIDWRGGLAGDHIRVLTLSSPEVSNLASTETLAAPIPEPSTYALMAGGLLAVLFMSRRRRPQD